MTHSGGGEGTARDRSFSAPWQHRSMNSTGGTFATIKTSNSANCIPNLPVTDCVAGDDSLQPDRQLRRSQLSPALRARRFSTSEMMQHKVPFVVNVCCAPRPVYTRTTHSFISLPEILIRKRPLRCDKNIKTNNDGSGRLGEHSHHVKAARSKRRPRGGFCLWSRNG